METITINEIKKKDSGLVIVKYVRLTPGGNPAENLEATMNTKWQEQEVDFMLKDVGVGGSVSVLIEQKGNYTNITKVDLTSAKKGEAPINKEFADEVIKKIANPEPSRDDKIVAQVLVKCAVKLIDKYNGEGQLDEILCDNVKALHGAYLVALDRLK